MRQALALMSLFGCLLVAAPASAGGTLHIGLDAQWSRQQIRFISPGDFVDCEGCAGLQDVQADMLRGTLSFGLGGIALEGSIAQTYQGPHRLGTWSAGVRLDTSYDAVVSAAFRFHYLRRWGDLEGNGGRAAFLLQVRPIRAIVLYAEVGADVTNVPGFTETLLSYTITYAGGLRFVFAR